MFEHLPTAKLPVMRHLFLSFPLALLHAQVSASFDCSWDRRLSEEDSSTVANFNRQML